MFKIIQAMFKITIFNLINSFYYPYVKCVGARKESLRFISINEKKDTTVKSTYINDSQRGWVQTTSFFHHLLIKQQQQQRMMKMHKFLQIIMKGLQMAKHVSCVKPKLGFTKSVFTSLKTLYKTHLILTVSLAFLKTKFRPKLVSVVTLYMRSREVKGIQTTQLQLVLEMLLNI